MSNAEITQMSVSVQVLVVDGSRRMSHKFFRQIPNETFFSKDPADDWSLVAGAQPWGYVLADYFDSAQSTVTTGPMVVGVIGGRLVKMDSDDAVRLTLGLEQWQVRSDPGVQDVAGVHFDLLVDSLDQLYLGG